MILPLMQIDSKKPSKDRIRTAIRQQLGYVHQDLKYEYEVHVKTELIAHKVMGCTCPLSGEKLQGNFPVGITGSKQYGAGVSALVNTLLTVGCVSVDRTKQLLSCLHIPISTGAIQNMMEKAAAAAVEPVNRIKGKVSGKDVVQFDETGVRAAGSLHWLHCVCSGPWRFYTVHRKRGEEGMEAMGILPEFTGVAVHDFWSSYKKFRSAMHAMCCQHLERELVFAEETGNQKWAGKLRKLLQGMCYAKNQQMAEGKSSFTEEELQQYMKRYDRITDTKCNCTFVQSHAAASHGIMMNTFRHDRRPEAWHGCPLSEERINCGTSPPCSKAGKSYIFPPSFTAERPY